MYCRQREQQEQSVETGSIMHAENLRQLCVLYILSDLRQLCVLYILSDCKADCGRRDWRGRGEPGPAGPTVPVLANSLDFRL